MELQGKVIVVCEPRSGVSKSTGNAWMTQDYVIETHEQFPKRMMFNVFGEDKIKQFDIKENDHLKVSFDPRAEQKDGHWYGNSRAWNVERIDTPADTSSTQQTSVTA